MSCANNSRTDRDTVCVVDSGGPKEACIIKWGAHWRHLVNTTEQSMSGDDAACCQIILTIVVIVIISRSHCSTTYIDVAHCYRPSSMVCRSVCHSSEPCKNGLTDLDAIWLEESDRPKEPCIRWGPDVPMERGNSEGGRAPHCKV